MANLQPMTIQVKLKAKGLLAKALLLRRITGKTVHEHPDLPKTVFQCLCAFSFLYGLSYFSVPAALMVGGIGGILAMERQ